VNAVQINRANISEAFSFGAWQRLQDLGLSEEGIVAKRIELYRKLVSQVVDPEEFKRVLVELGLAIIKVNVTRNKGYAMHQSVAIAGPEEAFEELDRWWHSQTGRDCPLYLHLEPHHANSPLVRDRWERAVSSGTPFTVGALSDHAAKL
jgi:hypothetical protein